MPIVDAVLEEFERCYHHLKNRRDTESLVCIVLIRPFHSLIGFLLK